MNQKESSLLTTTGPRIRTAAHFLAALLTYLVSTAYACSTVELTKGDQAVQELFGRRCPVIQLWPDGKGPDEILPATEEAFRQSKKADDIIRLTDVTKPTITIVAPQQGNSTGRAVVVCPGGGYGILAINMEGTEIVQWLNSIGITGIVLKYRVPRREHGFPKHHHALQDAQRALGIVRARAGQWGIDPGKIGICGFSAGGNLSALTCSNFQKRTYAPIDECDKTSCRPDFALLIYPAYLTDPVDSDQVDAMVGNLAADTTPPIFMTIAQQDKFAPGAMHYYLALRAAKVPCEFHLFPEGKHGGGLRESHYPFSEWSKLCKRWLNDLEKEPQ